MDRGELSWTGERGCGSVADRLRSGSTPCSPRRTTGTSARQPYSSALRRGRDRPLPAGRAALDAACGTGRYFGMILQAGRQVVGVDQSGGMLAEARATHPEVTVEKVGLQELTFVAEFDAAICVDAMENVFPEDWPTVLSNLRRAVRDGGHLYLTVERIDQQKLTAAYDDATAAGLPVLPGETSRGGGYHYYPALEQVAGVGERRGPAGGRGSNERRHRLQLPPPADPSQLVTGATGVPDHLSSPENYTTSGMDRCGDVAGRLGGAVCCGKELGSALPAPASACRPAEAGRMTACLGGGRILAQRHRRGPARRLDARLNLPQDGPGAARPAGRCRGWLWSRPRPGRRGWKRARRQDDHCARQATPRLAETRRSITSRAAPSASRLSRVPAAMRLMSAVGLLVAGASSDNPLRTWVR